MAFNVETLVLGAVQGLCEFLPISSSGHLALFQMFFGLDQGGLLSFDVLLHCATMLAVLVFFWKDVTTIAGQWLRGLLFSSERDREGWRMGWFILLSSAVTALMGLPLKGTVERAMASPLVVGGGLLLTGTILALTPLFADRQGKLCATAAIVIGLAQGVAVLPGISRSGATIAAGLLMGLAVGEAFRFSFLISIPAVLGATLLELLNIHRAGTVAALPEGWVWAVAVAFVLGWLSLRLLRCLVLSGRWAYFGFYCLLVGSAAILVALDLF